MKITNRDMQIKNVLNIQCAEQIRALYPDAAGRLLQEEPMADHSSFKVGGAADLVFLPASVEELTGALRIANELGVPVTFIGNGSNILVSDKGIRGLTVIFGKAFSDIRMENETVLSAQAGALLSSVAKFAAKKELTGMEFAAGIPGSVGGAVYMNAGAYDGCMADIVVKTQGLDPVKGELFFVDSVQAHDFDYRKSFYAENEMIVLNVWIQLKKGDPAEIAHKMDDFSIRRRNSQPVELPSAGSTFKRPAGYFAGRLIEEAGLKGCRIGGACVSVKHAGFIVNDRKATAQDVLDLIHHVQECVYNKHGVRIDPEVRILGEW